MLRSLALTCAGILAFVAAAFLFAEDSFNESALKSRLTYESVAKIEIEKAPVPNAGIITNDAGKLVEASIEAGGGRYLLDVRNNPAAEKELLRFSVLTHGDARQPLMTVSGLLEFRPVAQGKPEAGIRPVIVVKSLKITLGHPGEQLRPFGIKPLNVLED